MLVTSLIFTTLAIGLLTLFTKVRPARKLFLKAKNALMWSSLARSQIQTYFGGCLILFQSMKDEGCQFKYLMQCALFLSFPKFCYWFIKKKLKEGKLDTPDYIKRVGTLYQNLHTGK